jgi:hypothetical protein
MVIMRKRQNTTCWKEEESESCEVAQASACVGFALARAKFHKRTDRGKSSFCHPEQSEGSAFLCETQETADSSGKTRPSE